MATHAREVFTGPDGLLPEVPMCGRSDQDAARPGLPPHVHEDAFEFCLISRGEVDWWAEDRIFTVRAGQVYFTRPGERHGGIGSMMHPCELYWFQLTGPERDSGSPHGTEHDPLVGVRRDLEALPARVFNASDELQTSIRAVVDEHRYRDAGSMLAARAALHRALVLFVREGRAARAVALSEPVQHALTWMTRRESEPFTVADVARAVGLSVVRLQARFQRELHTSIGAYRTRVRLHAAKLLLRESERPVTRIAHDLGFSSSQYFATVFRKHVGVPPSAYRSHGQARGDTPLTAGPGRAAG